PPWAVAAMLRPFLIRYEMEYEPDIDWIRGNFGPKHNNTLAERKETYEYFKEYGTDKGRAGSAYCSPDTIRMPAGLHPQDYTHRTTLLQKGKLAPNGYVWMELSVANFNTGKLQPGEPRRNVGRFSAPVPVGLTKEQKDYFAARMRMRIKDETGK